ncbi:MAG: BamA/TamA family outer membrane protein [Bacteroidetes bacterium]|nr:BamA/TamA family outer membrane protein [Bacteroidota bacterium]
MKHLIRFVGCFFSLVLLAVLCGCNTTQFLDKSKGEQYLHKNVIEIDQAGGKIKNKSSLSYELSKLYLQKPNRKMFGVPRQYFYFMARDTFDKSKIGMAAARWKAKRGEEPVIVDTFAASQTEKAMASYLKNRGYLFAEVQHEIKSNKKKTKATVTYFVKPDGRFLIDTLIFECRDTAIQRILREISAESLLQPGNPVDVKLYDQEVARITRYLRNHGYAYFYPQYVSSLEGFDSSNVEKTVSIRLKVLTPPGRDTHQRYAVGNIYIFPDYDPSLGKLTPDTLVDGMFFGNAGRPFRVKPHILANSIFFRSGELYNQDALDNSLRQLGTLGVFRPPTLRLEEDTLHPGTLNFFMYLTANKKWEIGYDFELNSTERQGLLGNYNLIGLSFNPSLRNRNFLKGAELLVGNLNFGVELNPFGNSEKIINAMDFRWQNELYFPRFTDYFGLWKGLRKWGVTGEDFNKNLRQKATSRMSAGYNMLILRKNYNLHFFNMSFGFEVPVSVNHRVSVNHFGVDLVLPNIVEGSRFDSLLDANPSLRTSFNKQLITGLLFRDINFVYTSPPKPAGNSWYFRGYFDLSGLEVLAANSIYNAVATNPVTFNFFDVDFSHYAKLELDGRRYWQFGPERSFIARLSTGIARPFYRSKTVPYVKQFYVGGPYSVRGWYTRELGPGLYKNPATDDPANRSLYYQAGDMKLEFNLEYRFFMVRPLNLFNLYGATFLDGGNIWTKDKDASRPGSQFALDRVVENGIIVQDNFLREIGLATGFGTRWDFTYFILRLDFGTAIRRNYPDPERANSYFVDFSKWDWKNDIRYQLALGYPF